MVTRRIVVSLLALALGAGSAEAFNPQPEPPGREVTLQDGTKVFIDRNGRAFVFQPAKDGTYRTRDGQTITVTRGSIGAPKDPLKGQTGPVGTTR